MIVYDIECIRPPVPRSGQELGDYLYATGWEDYKGMGIAVCAWYDYMDDQMHYFTEDMIVKMGTDIYVSGAGVQLREVIDARELICGFNICKYDNNMLRAHGISIDDSQCYDIQREFIQAIGLDPDRWDNRTHSGYGLDAILKANGLPVKTGHGADAPYMWQDGKRQEVIDYCKDDAHRERLVLEKIFETGGLINPKTGQHVRMAMPSI